MYLFISLLSRLNIKIKSKFIIASQKVVSFSIIYINPFIVLFFKLFLLYGQIKRYFSFATIQVFFFYKIFKILKYKHCFFFLFFDKFNNLKLICSFVKLNHIKNLSIYILNTLACVWYTITNYTQWTVNGIANKK